MLRHKPAFPSPGTCGLAGAEMPVSGMWAQIGGKLSGDPFQECLFDFDRHLHHPSYGLLPRFPRIQANLVIVGSNQARLGSGGPFHLAADFRLKFALAFLKPVIKFLVVLDIKPGTRFLFQGRQADVVPRASDA